MTRVAATADLHVRHGDDEKVREMFRDVNERADVLVLAGDLTHHGRAAEAETLLRGLDDVDVPILVVLGNHDHNAGSPEEVLRILSARDVRCIEGKSVVVDGVGFAGAKGFGGGFDTHEVRGFGEAATKAFVAESIMEAELLRTGLRSANAPRKVAVTHFAPVADTVHGEPPQIHPFMGASRLAQPIDAEGATLALHGHAHHGSFEGKTPGGVRVVNVSLPVLTALGMGPFVVLDV